MKEYKIDTVQIKQFTSSNEILSYISLNLIKPGYDLAFRGQREESWELKPTISRYLEKKEKEFNHDYKGSDDLRTIVEKRLLQTYKENIKRNQDIPEDRIDKIDLWQLGQHHGLPTPLLDWTRSPYVGLFFAICEDAVIDNNIACDRALWVLNLTMLKEINFNIDRNIWPKLKKKMSDSILHTQVPKMDVVTNFDGDNRRIVYQQGLFTKHVHYRSFQVWLGRIAREISHDLWSEPVLTKVIIPGDLKLRNELMIILDKMNINYRTLFPDLYGSAADAAENVVQRMSADRFKQLSASQSDYKQQQIKEKKI